MTDDEMDVDCSESEEVYLPGQPLKEDEELQVDQSAYIMLYSVGVKWPALSFDILEDNFGLNRTLFPHTAYIVAGSQSDRAASNQITVMKMSQMEQIQEEEEEEEVKEKVPDLNHRSFSFYGCVNRIRAFENYVAAWSDATSKVDIYDISRVLESIETNQQSQKPNTLYQVKHQTEGFALDWSRLTRCSLLSGDLFGNIKLTQNFKQAGNFFCSKSVEDLQWSPNEATVFAACGQDCSLSIFDTRQGNRAAIQQTISDCDVNVISWNRITPFLMASGDDVGRLAVWDLRQLSNAAASFQWHKDPITSLEWHSHDESSFAASADDQVTIWDLSTERDNDDSGVEVPQQLMFVHQGQQHLKEIHWHKQIPGCLLSTALSGINIFKTINS